MTQRQPFSLPEAVQFLGAFLAVAGFFLLLYMTLARVLLFFAPAWGAEWVRAFAETTAIDVVSDPVEKVLIAFGLLISGGLVVFLSGLWARSRGLL